MAAWLWAVPDRTWTDDANRWVVPVFGLSVDFGAGLFQSDLDQTYVISRNPGLGDSLHECRSGRSALREEPGSGHA